MARRVCPNLHDTRNLSRPEGEGHGHPMAVDGHG